MLSADPDCPWVPTCLTRVNAAASLPPTAHSLRRLSTTALPNLLTAVLPTVTEPARLADPSASSLLVTT